MSRVDEKALLADFIIFTDGACSGNPGPGGWAAIVATKSGQVVELGGRVDPTTNNRMEMVAVLRALRNIEDKVGTVMIFTDSTYVIRGITQWVWAWKKKNWKNAAGEEVQNRDIWEALFDAVMKRKGPKLEWHYSRGHDGIPGNERCDKIAVEFSQNRRVQLYQGSLLQYTVPIFDLPEDTSLPEMKPKEEKKAAYSYLSFLGGVVFRHRDWPSCERRVKGQSGAKFKKAMSAADEKKILEDWGLSSQTEIRE